jgi:phenylpyruvate tautomerase PptA (4-oxalocrotonate tautomerase family)
MPTYVCSVPNGKLSDLQNQEIATAISNRHSEATGALPFFVQVVVEGQRDIEALPSWYRYR